VQFHESIHLYLCFADVDRRHSSPWRVRKNREAEEAAAAMQRQRSLVKVGFRAPAHSGGGGRLRAAAAFWWWVPASRRRSTACRYKRNVNRGSTGQHNFGTAMPAGGHAAHTQHGLNANQPSGQHGLNAHQQRWATRLKPKSAERATGLKCNQQERTTGFKRKTAERAHGS